MFVEFKGTNGMPHVVNTDHVLYAYADPQALGTVKLVMQIIPVATHTRLNITTFTLDVQGTLSEVQCALSGQPILDLRN